MLLKKSLIAYLLVFFTFLSTIPLQASSLTAFVLEVTDGNTLTVEFPNGKQQQVDLLGVADHELDDCFTYSSQKWLADFALGKEVSIKPTQYFEQNRSLVRLYRGYLYANLDIIRSGYARYNKKHAPWLGEQDSQKYLYEEQQASMLARGEWASCGTPEVLSETPKVSQKAPIIVNSNNKIKGKVLEVQNGKTFVLSTTEGTQLPVCINYLETPEPGQRLYDAALQHLKNILLGSEVTVVFQGQPGTQSNCVKANVYKDDVNINLHMIREGMAWAYRQHPYPEDYVIYAKAQTQARGESKGIWKDRYPTPPWEYRGEWQPSQKVIDLYGTVDSDGDELNSSEDYKHTTGRRVHVKSYVRKDGTRVKAHTRRYPRSRN